MDNGEMILLKLYGIEWGYINYLPKSIPAVRNVDAILKDIFATRTTEPINGHDCLFKADIQNGLRKKVLKELGKTCIVCKEYFDKGINVHHIKPGSRSWGNPFGLTVLCEKCHKMIRYGIGKTTQEVKVLCNEVTSPDSPYYDPPSDIQYPEPTLVKTAHCNYYHL